MHSNATRLYVFLATALLLWAPVIGQVRRNPESIYLFTYDARFVEISLTDLKIIDVGNLWYLKVIEIGGVIQGIPGGILLSGKTWRLLNIKQPSREEFQRFGVIKLVRTPKGGLLFSGLFQPPSPELEFIGGRTFDLDGPKVFLTWANDNEDRQDLLVTVHDPRGRRLATFPDFTAFPRSCLSDDGTKVYSPAIGPEEIAVLDYPQSTVSILPYRVGSSRYFSKGVVAASTSSCEMLIGERAARESPKTTLYLYDYQSGIVQATLEVNRKADFQLLPGRRAIVLDEKRDMPMDGGGTRPKKLGRLDLLNLSGSVQQSFRLPEDGNLIAVSADEKLGFYISPGMLTILDFENGKVFGEVAIPFVVAKLAFWSRN